MYYIAWILRMYFSWLVMSHIPPFHLLCLCQFQVMSIEEVERIMDETQEAIEYQRVRI